MLAHVPRPLLAVTEEEASQIRRVCPDLHLELTERGLHPQHGAPNLALSDWLHVAEQLPELRAELLHGHLVCMGLASPSHEALVAQLIGQLVSQLRGSPCRVYGSNLGIQAGTSYVNADVTVVCGPMKHLPERPSIVTNPTVVFEVTSPRTESRDRGEKLDAYASVEALQTVVVVSRESKFVTVYTRGPRPASWVMTTTRGGSIALDPHDLNLDVDELYAEATPELPS